MGVCDKLHLDNGSRVIDVWKMSHFVVFRSSWSREREWESGTVTCHVSLFSALAASSSGMCDLFETFIGCCMLAIVGWCYELMNVRMKIRGPCQGPDRTSVPLRLIRSWQMITCYDGVSHGPLYCKFRYQWIVRVAKRSENIGSQAITSQAPCGPRVCLKREQNENALTS